MDTIDIIFLLLIGWWIWNSISIKKQQLEQFNMDVAKKVAEVIHEIRPEKHGDIMYWFDMENDRFLAQGRNSTELINHLKSRFPDHLFYIKSDGKSHILSSGTDWKITQIELSKS